jgi:hypothetical protein
MGPNQARASAEQGAELEVETTDDANRFAWHGGRVSEERSAFDRRRERGRAAGRFGSSPEGRLCSDVGCCRRDGRLELDARRRRLERQKDDQASEQGADQTDECRAPRRHLLMLNHRKLLVQPGTVVRALELQALPNERPVRRTNASDAAERFRVEERARNARDRFRPDFVKRVTRELCVTEPKSWWNISATQHGAGRLCERRARGLDAMVVVRNEKQ